MEITYKWTKERFLEASKANYDIKLSEPKFRLLGYAGLAAMLLGIYLAYTTGLYTTLNAATALTLYWYTLRWPLYRLQLASRFKKYASRNHTVYHRG